MKKSFSTSVGFFFLLFAHLLASFSARAGGVTIITHGYNSDVNGWITGMANAIPGYPSFPGSNYTIYKVTLTTDGANNFFYQWQRTNGIAPTLTDSGEIIVKLDWSQMAGALFNSSIYNISTLIVAQQAANVLLATNAIPELNGHALADFPLHLVGHSRGGSLVSELSRILGTNGVWVDHVTTLDPHPLNADGFSDPFSVTDASASNTYANVLFADNYWQHMGDGTFTPNGEPVRGAFVRELTSLSGGNSSTHSDVHLWYYGTINLATPANDTEATITTNERATWWVAAEQRGTNAGELYSLIGGGNRFSTNRPVGAGFPAIVDGYNKWWDLGAGTSTTNRTLLTNNNGSFPNLLRLNRTATNPVVPGQNVPLTYYYQWAQPVGSNATIRFYLDNDANPLNTNQTLMLQTNVPGTGASNVAFSSPPLVLPTNATAGTHAVFASITANNHIRYLYAPEKILVVPAPTLDIAQLNPTQFRIGVNGSVGQVIILQTSSNLTSWQSLITNTLTTNRWIYTNTPPAGSPKTFYRTLLN